VILADKVQKQEACASCETLCTRTNKWSS